MSIATCVTNWVQKISALGVWMGISLGERWWQMDVGIEILLSQWGKAPKIPNFFLLWGGCGGKRGSNFLGGLGEGGERQPNRWQWTKLNVVGVFLH
jgi:hypothetical protein